MVEWCLVVTTPEEAILCALAREEVVHSESGLTTGDTHLKLIPTRYEIPTDSIPLLSVCGTDEGRIFLGGYDGCLYEMAYEGFIRKNQLSHSTLENRLNDMDDSFHDYRNSGLLNALSTEVANKGKRALSTLLFGPTVTTSDARSRKCRKVNHTSVAPHIVTAFVPGFILKASSVVFGADATTSGGPILSLTIDKGRSTLYALTSKGFVHAYDLSSGISSATYEKSSSSVKLACTVDIVKSVRRYLDCVSHGRMNPPSTPSDSTVASILFPGGASGAIAGVGGMEGARIILKKADSENIRSKSKSKSRNGKLRSENCIHPLSIHVVPEGESKYLTLVVVSSGGLRYYLSVIPDSGNNMYSTNSNRPGRRFSLCHVRAPPSFSTDDDVKLDNNLDKPSGSLPGMQRLNTDTMACASQGYYMSGVTLLAIDIGKDTSDDTVGDCILTLTPDYTKISSTSTGPTSANQYSNSILPHAISLSNTSGGIKEIAAQPMLLNNSSSVLRGGHVWEINANSYSVLGRDPVLDLFYKSSTPTSYPQNDTILNPYIPSRRNESLVLKSPPKHAHTPIGAAATQSTDVQSYGGLLTYFKSLIMGKTAPLTGPFSTMHQKFKMYYLIANRYGCDPRGFSNSASIDSTNNYTGPKLGQSARLSHALLHPNVTALSELCMQHLLINKKEKGICVLNSGGLHYFKQIQPIEKLGLLLLASKSSSIGRDENVKDFFRLYGYSEGCYMALSIAIHEVSSESLAEKAIQAALGNAHRPTLTPKSVTFSSDSVSSSTVIDSIRGYEGFTFKSSALYDGVLALACRLLRPFWCKPAVVVTESKLLPSKTKGMRPKVIPAKVELLLDESTLEKIRRPLAALQRLMRDRFAPAILSVPGSSADDVDMMDISETSDAMTKAIQYHSQMNRQNDSKDSIPHEKELRNVARLQEDRNMHALYRLLSRTVQLLQLVSYLRTAHLTPELPEIEFGLLHGLTYSQLVTSKASQDRIEAVLTDLFSRDSTMSTFGHDSDGSSISTVESENLSSLLHRNCYLYFSVGSRLSFLGFKNAYAAISQQSHSRKSELISNASSNFRLASKYWHSLVHVMGGISDSKFSSLVRSSNVSTFAYFNDIAKSALEYGSPLARAAAVLLELNDVVGIVDICLECAKNFDPSVSRKLGDIYGMIDNLDSSTMLSWEKSLYHGRQIDEGSDRLSVISPFQQSNQVGKQTCYALLCHHLNKLLESATHSPQYNILTERMLATASSSLDADFLSLFFEYLSSSSFVDAFLRIDSVALEDWLLHRVSDFDLLWRYYTIHNIHWMAGEVAWNRGASDEHVLLSERLEYLSRALNSYTIAQSEYGNSFGANHDNSISPRRQPNSLMNRYSTNIPSRDDLSRCSAQISEMIDVAKIQARILVAIEQSLHADKVDQNQLNILKMKIVSVSDLYNLYACPMGMYDICLSIVQSCKYDDDATILMLWKSVMCEELLPCRTGNTEVVSFFDKFKENSMLEDQEVVLSDKEIKTITGENLTCFDDGDWKTGLTARVVNLGRELFRDGTNFAFPIQHIADWLESINRIYCSVSGSSEHEWVLKTLLDARASYPSIAQAYDANLGIISDSSLKLSQLANLAKVLETWLNDAIRKDSVNDSGMSASSELNTLKRYKTAVLNQVNGYKVTLDSMINVSPDSVAMLQNVFNNIERDLHLRL